MAAFRNWMRERDHDDLDERKMAESGMGPLVRLCCQCGILRRADVATSDLSGWTACSALRQGRVGFHKVTTTHEPRTT